MTTTQLVVVTICAVIDVCAVLALGAYLCNKLIQHGDKKRLNLRAKEEQTFLQNEFYNATSDILRETVRHRFNGGNRY
jgi:hypothetical protein